ncbi:class I adenylate-forming enzyme family protein [[Mycobacterium] zoologicum]|uniref:class I adenylate-forming enzyme family protein n=1 Tax=[Mycobacterium] zoologicum TaxID=2872311 RepID=UPI001CDAF6F2|nr:AMP-binding protein [Mycolicibacter sp. MYC101]MEB3061943.1 AMP-binding protein [Mycolicibacter sp. MYC101]
MLDPDIRGLPDVVRGWSDTHPDKAALIAPDRVVTYAQLDDRSNRIGSALVRAGIRPGSHIGYLGKNSAALFEIWLGTNKAGCALTPLNWRCAPAELAEVVGDARLPLIFAGSDCIELAGHVRDATQTPVEVVPEDTVADWAENAGTEEPAIRLVDDTIALLAYTSGTTATPKGVPISHGALMRWFSAASAEPSVSWDSEDIGLMVMPNFHLAGTWVSLSALYHGASLAILPEFDPTAFVAAVTAHRPTVTCLVPTAIQLLLNHEAARSGDFSSLRRILYAGSPIGPHTLQQALRLFGCDFVQFYGTTETFIITLLRPDQHCLDDPDLLKSCGQPMPAVELRIIDPAGCDVAPGNTGEILVRSPWMFNGYWNKPDATTTAIHDGWYHTGDAGVHDAGGNVFLVDRLKDMIISGGENIYSAEVERALAAHPSVESVAVVGTPDDKWGERIVAFVVLRSHAQVDQSDLSVHCRGLIAGYKVPKEIHLVGALPHTASGKVQKAVLREQLREAQS